MKIEQPIGEDIVSSSAGPEEMSSAKEQMGELLSKILELPQEHREVLELRFVSQLSIQDTADTLGRSLDSVKGMQYRALEALREKMKSWKEVNHE